MSLTRRLGVTVAALLILAVSLAVAVGIGSVSVPVDRVVDVVLRRLSLSAADVTRLEDQIVWQLRLPRALGAAAVGAALAGCGAVLQSLTRNDLADPYLLGIASGAQVGAVTVVVLGVSVAGATGGAALTVAGFLGALTSLFIVLSLAAGRHGSLSPTRVVLAGVVVAYVCAAYSTLMILVVGDSHAARRVLTWTFGSLAGIRWGSAVYLLILAIVAVLFFSLFSDALDAFAFGESSARSLGIPVNRVRWALMVGTALATAGAVAYVGAIGFVGLVIPHIARILIGPQHRILLPVSALLGALLLVWADTLARSVVEGSEIPVGVITALVGAPFFAWLLRRTDRTT